MDPEVAAVRSAFFPNGKVLTSRVSDYFCYAVGRKPDKRSEYKEEDCKSIVVQQWEWLLKLQRLYGSFPLAITSGAEPFRFQFWSKITLYTALISAVRLVLCVKQFSSWGEYLLGRSYGNSVEDWIVLSTNTVVPIINVWDLICIWAVLHKTAHFFNCWGSFARQYHETFCKSQVKCPKEKEVENESLTSLSGCEYKSTVGRWGLILFIASLAVNLSIVISSWLFVFRHKEETPPYVHFLVTCIKILLLTILSGEEIKKFLMYHALREAFRNIRHSIQARLREAEPGPETTHQLLNVVEICKWRKLLIRLKEMVKLAGNIQAPHESIVLIHTVVIYTESLFILVKAFLTQSWSSSALLFGIMTWSIVARLIVKIILAQRITDEENRIAELLMDVDSTATDDVFSNIELRRVTELIRSAPAKISLSGFIIIDKQLLPKISSYVVAYLVVLLQFHLSTNLLTDCAELDSTSASVAHNLGIGIAVPDVNVTYISF